MKKLLLAYGLIFTLWSLYRAFFSFPEAFDEFVAKPILWIIPITSVMHRRLSFSFPSFFRMGSMGAILVGIGTGLFLSFIRLGGVVVYSRSLSAFISFPTNIFFTLLLSLATAFSEEVVFRGYILPDLFDRSHKKFLANFITTVLFVLMHVPIVFLTLHYSLAQAALYFAIITVVSLISGILYFRFRAILAPIAFHTVWNFLSTVIP